MDIMLILQIIVLLGAIFLGIRLGGIAIGYAGGLGVIVLGLCLGMKPAPFLGMLFSSLWRLSRRLQLCSLQAGLIIWCK